MSTTQPPAEAVLIERLRQQLPGRQGAVSKVAKLAGISEGRWRQIAKGYQQATRDTRVPVTAPADTLARMAAAVSATPDDLVRAGRKDAADELRKLQVPTIPMQTGARLLREIPDEALVAELSYRLSQRHSGSPSRRGVTEQAQNFPSGSPSGWRLSGEETGVLGDEHREERNESRGG